ncbi:hypothetical protein ACFL53_00490 [Pseudomonadota bacterium]
MNIRFMFYSFIDIFFGTYTLTAIGLSLLFVTVSLASRKITHMTQAIVLGGIAIYDSFSVISVFTYLSMFIMSMSAPLRVLGAIRRGTITNPVIIKSLLLLIILLVIILATVVVVMLAFIAADALELDPTFSYFTSSHP